MTREEIQEDIECLDHNDPEIARALKHLRNLHRQKGIVYRELAASRFYGHHIKYLVQDDHGKLTVTDLDNNKDYNL